MSGSGKSTLVNEVLYKAVANRLHRAQQRPGAHKRIRGLEQLDKIINVDQSPIGRTPRSNPATYIGLFDQIRDLFSKTQEARARGYKPGRFSFNVKGGRCEVCRGDGQIKIEMHFLPDVYVPCEQCHGKRYNRETLDIRFKGKTIADVLDMPVEEALEFFAHIPKIQRRLQALHDVGLDYMRLGQPATTLSGGEAQRVKLATELCKVATGRTLYILDEPTTGLHFADIQRLLEVLQRLVDAGQLGRRDRAQPRRHQDRRPDHRHGPGGRRGGRPAGRRRHARGGRRAPRARTPASSSRDRRAGGAQAPRAAAREGAGGGLSAATGRPTGCCSVQGRIARIVAGSLLIIIGLGLIGGVLGVLLMIIGAIPIASAAVRDAPDRAAVRARHPRAGGRRTSRRRRRPATTRSRATRRTTRSPSRSPTRSGGAPPLARRRSGPRAQGPRTKDLRADEPAEDDAQR